MSKKLLTFLGMGEYDKVTYVFGEEKMKVKAAQIASALTVVYTEKWTSEDSIIVFTTPEAKALRWPALENELLALKKIKDYKWDLKFRMIPNVRNDEDIREVFRIIVEALDNRDEVIFDITHSFRSIPFISLVAINYAKLIKKVNILRIIYGVYVENQQEANILNLSPLNELLELTFSVHSFIKHGDAGGLRDIVTKSGKDDSYYGKSIADVFDAVADFSSDISVCRGFPANDDKSWNRKTSFVLAYKAIKDAIEKAKDTFNKDGTFSEMNLLMQLIEDKTQSFNTDDVLMLSLAFIKWCIDANMIQQGYTALEEALKTFVIVNYKDIIKKAVPDAQDKKMLFNQNIRFEIANKVLTVSAENEKGWKIKEQYRDVIKEIIGKVPKDLKSISWSIKKYRNSINHMGFAKERISHEELKDKLKEFYTRFEHLVLEDTRENI